MGLEDSPSGERSRHHALQAEESSLVREKITTTTSVLISERKTPQKAIPLIIRGHG